MLALRRRGFTLVEVLITMIIMGIVTAALYRVLLNNQRAYRSETQHIELQQNIRAAATLFPAELRELDAADSDITAMSATSLSIRAMRYLGIACDVPTLGIGAVTGIKLTIRQSPFWGARRIQPATDSLLIFYERSPETRKDDAWATARPLAVVSGPCPDGNPGWVITMDLSVGPSYDLPDTVGGIINGAPVRGFVPVTYQLYQPVDTSYYIGMQTAGGTAQPLIGPVLSNGLTFSYYDSTGNVTTDPEAVARIDFVVRARTPQPIRSQSGGPRLANAVDSISSSVALRNNPRF